MTTPLERVALLRISIAAIEARQRKTPPGPAVRMNADEWEKVYLELVELERSLNIPDYDDRLMAEPFTEEEKKWIEDFEKDEENEGSICDCDSDGECSHCQELRLDEEAEWAEEYDAAAAPICNCDSDGECSYCHELRLDTERMEAEARKEESRWNAVVDTREGCARCTGCAYCSEGGGYDGADEV
jgi:hypothetical protein